MKLLHTKWIGKILYHFKELDSTNKKAKELAAEGADHGTLILADSQTAGVGRRGRTWSSEDGTGIYMSLVLRPELAVEQTPMVTLVAAIAVAKGIEGLLREKMPCKEISAPMIKWPNDIVLNGKKICGILTELHLDENRLGSMVVGIGINVNNEKFPEEIAQLASSLYMETGLQLEREVLLEAIGQRFEHYYSLLEETKDLSLFQEEYESLLVNKNQEVKVLEPKGAYTGTALGITNTGELLVNTGKSIHTVGSGEVSVRGLYGYV